MMSLRAAVIALLLGCVLLVGLRSVSNAQAGIHYVFDRLGRLTAVVDQTGSSAEYAYDRTGNLLSIQRSDSTSIAGPIGITLVSPRSGRVGSTVSIFGKGFSATLSENTIAFNGVLATVISAELNAITASVPPGATTGPITVTSPLGSATSSVSFTIQ
jgi:YD repeat-containing protein